MVSVAGSSKSEGSEFRYRFAAHRTFSSQSKRPLTSPARIALGSRTSSRSKRKAFSSPEDIVAMAQTSPFELMEESLSGSLLMLQGRYKRVKPAHFLELSKLSKQPQQVLPMSPRFGSHTPYLVKQLAKKIGNRNVERKQVSTQTSAGEAFAASVDWSQQASLANDLRDVMDTINGVSVGLSRYSNSSVEDRCVRCAEIPDIQIEGRSLSRIRTNTNVLMAKEHCEILGPYSCPDCAKTRSQRSHQRRCQEVTPSAPTDVYKLALVHERAPHLSMREVQRKVYDGDISDRIFTPLRCSTAPSISESRDMTVDEINEEKTYFVTNRGRDSTHKVPPHSSNSVRNRSAFETIHETSESPDGSDSEGSTNQVTKTFPEMNQLIYREVEAEKAFKVDLIAGKDDIIVHKINIDLKNAVTAGNTAQSEKHPLVRRNAGITDTFVKQSIGDHDDAEAEQHARAIFTHGVVPSTNFFFDIADLSDRLRRSAIAEQVNKRRQREEVKDFLHALEQSGKLKVADQQTNEESKIETGSIESSDSSRRVLDFNMSYEPPILFENKGRYLGVKVPSYGRRSSGAKNTQLKSLESVQK